MLKILVVEDDAASREMLVRRLLRHDFDVEFAVSGRGAVDLASAWLPDVILMDVALGPGIDGWEATSALKADARTSNIPVIALSAHALVTDRDRSILAGCIDHDIKPVNFERLLSKIKLAVQGSIYRGAVSAIAPEKSALGIRTKFND